MVSTIFVLSSENGSFSRSLSLSLSHSPVFLSVSLSSHLFDSLFFFLCLSSLSPFPLCVYIHLLISLLCCFVEVQLSFVPTSYNTNEEDEETISLEVYKGNVNTEIPIPFLVCIASGSSRGECLLCIQSCQFEAVLFEISCLPVFWDFNGTFAEVDAICAQFGTRICAKHMFQPNRRSTTVPINVINDDIAEGEESFVVELCKLEDMRRKLYFSSRNQATITIRDDDGEPLATCGVCIRFSSVNPLFASSCFDWFYSRSFPRRRRQAESNSVDRQNRAD